MNESPATMQMLLIEDELDPHVPLVLPPSVRALYLRQGDARMGDEPLTTDTALFSDAATTVTGRGTLWRFEVTRRPPDWQPAPEDRARLLLARPLRRDPSLPFVLRLDRVNFTPDAETPRHGHFGQGIRRLLDGRLLLTIGDRVERRQPGEAWFETGEEPVTARGLLPDTAFIRALVMDGDMKGRSSFRAWTPADENRPRQVVYKLYLDEVARLG
jgi:quercetin dioxygenase-like cupin family protein